MCSDISPTDILCYAAQGWSDPRMPTISGIRRRGYTPEAIRLFAERVGISKADNNIDMSVLEDCAREVTWTYNMCVCVCVCELL